MQTSRNYIGLVECCHCRIVVIADEAGEAEIKSRPDRDTLSKSRHARRLEWWKATRRRLVPFVAEWHGSSDFCRGCSGYEGDDGEERIGWLSVGRGTKGKWCATANVKSMLASVPDKTMVTLMIRSESDANE